MCDFKPNIKPDAKICDTCRKQLAKEKSETHKNDADDPVDFEEGLDEDFYRILKQIS
jgi:hypothetical protein